MNFRLLSHADIDDILSIEEAVYSHPWTRRNFEDAFQNAYAAFGYDDERGQLMGYFVVMPMVDECHLMTIAVRPSAQGKGIAKMLLDKVVDFAQFAKLNCVMLEVRESNARAIHVYERFGFTRLGVRKNYYPVDAHTRENAILMRYDWEPIFVRSES